VTGEEELDRVLVVGDDGSWLTAIEFRLVDHRSTSRGPRRALGRREWRLSTGERLDVVGADAFLVRRTGEMLGVATT